MKIGFAKKDLSDAIILPAPNPGDKPHKEVIFSDREKKFVDLSDKLIRYLINEKRGMPLKVVYPVELSAIYGEDGNGPWAILSIDSCYFVHNTVDTIKAPLQTHLGIPGERVLVLPTHAHIWTSFDTEKLQQSILDAVNTAKNSMEEAEAAVLNLNIDVSGMCINRRIYVKGVGSRTLMFNDFCKLEENCIDASEQIGKWVEDLGCSPAEYLDPNCRYTTHDMTDDLLQAIFFRSAVSGKTIGTLINFACHPVIVSQTKMKGEISADYPGHLKKYIEEKVGGTAVFTQGASGNIRPLNTEYTHDYAKKFGENIASVVLNDFNTLDWKPLTKLQYFTEAVNLPLRSSIPENDEAATKKIEELETQYPVKKSAVERRTLQNEYRLCDFSMNELKNILRPGWLGKRQAHINLCALKVNDTAILACNGEIFTQTGKAMVEAFKNKQPIFISLANEYISYLVPADEIEKGGYETGVCICDPKSIDILVSSSEKLLSKVFSE